LTCGERRRAVCLWAANVSGPSGFATTEALVILGRKLLRVAFAVWKGTEVFDPTRLVPKTP
jgi:hypothetical protein